MNFRRINIDDYDLFNKYAGENINFENNFALNFIWDAVYPCYIAEFENVLMVRLSVGDNIVFDPPKTKDKSIDKYLYAASEYCLKNNTSLSFKILAKDYENLKQETKNDFSIENIEGEWDYIYYSKDLIGFEGSKFQKKRNLLSQFLKKYQYKFISYDSNIHFDSLISLQNDWLKTDNSPNLELPALKRALENLEKLKLFCDIIEIDGKVAAYSVSNINHNAGEILFEKGNIEYKGIYAAIVNFTAKKRFANCELVNREEDMGIENLKKGKLAYNPKEQIKKYLLKFK
jgi:hypothetical protein